MSELSFYTTRELIEELVRRKTFLGVIIQADEEQRTAEWGGDKFFNVHFNSNLDRGQACRLLDAVANHMDRNHC